MGRGGVREWHGRGKPGSEVRRKTAVAVYRDTGESDVKVEESVWTEEEN